LLISGPKAQPFDVAKLNIEEGPFERTTIRRYRLKQARQ
jgi:hypothetical protein